jgi:hypothetical protein
VQDSYSGNVQAAVIAFLRLHDKFGWKEQYLEDVTSIREEDETAYLLKSDANKNRLLQAIENVTNNRNLLAVNIDKGT